MISDDDIGIVFVLIIGLLVKVINSIYDRLRPERELHEAARSGNISEIAKYLDRGGDVNIANFNKTTALNLAVYNNQIEVVEFLIEKGADVNTGDSILGDFPVIKAAAVGNVEIVSLLISHGAVVNRSTKDGRTPLHSAIGSGSADLILMLIKAGANVNAKRKETGISPLHLAVMNDKKDVITNTIDITLILISSGADVNAKSFDGKTPLLIAMERENYEMVEILRKHGAYESI